MKKYNICKNESLSIKSGTVYRIVAVRDFGDVKAGTKGGYVGSESNLSHDGYCWIYEGSVVTENAVVKDNARVSGSVIVHGFGCISENALVLGGDGSVLNYNLKSINCAEDVVEIGGFGLVCGHSEVRHAAKILQHARICGYSRVLNRAVVKGFAEIGGNSVISGSARVTDHARIGTNAIVRGKAFVKNNAVVKDNAVVSGDTVIMGNYIIGGNCRVSKGVLAGNCNPVNVV